MPHKSLTTIQGQAWDQLALAEYGSENAMHLLLAANPQARGVLLFSGDKQISAPAAAESQKVEQESLPPWKRNLQAEGEQ